MAAPLIVRLVMDAAGYLKTVDTAVGANTKLEQSSLGVGEAMQVSATKSVQASLRATESLQAQVAGYRELAASATESAAVRERADLLATRAQNRLNASLGLTSVGLGGSSRAAQTAERDLGKTTRGLLAGSGAAVGLGRSLAFASTGFIAIAGGATLIKSSIEASIALAKTQRQVEAQLKTTGKTWDQYGGQIGTADLKLSHVSGFTNQELLQSFGYLVRVTGNVSEALKLNATAADVARGRNISLSAASIALGKALGGSSTALKRLGITIPPTLDRMQALAFVQEKFAGQAAAGATVGDRFHASLVDTEEIIGNALLPTFTRLTTEISDWLSKMNESGRLQRDVNDAVTVAGTVFHTLGKVIGFVDKVTGSFKTTLELVLGAFAISKVVAFGAALQGLAAKWGIVEGAAVGAGAAQTAALGEGEVAAASRIILPAGVGAGTAAAGGAAGAAGVTAGALVAPVAIVATGAFLLSQDKSRSWNLKNGGRLFQDSSGAFFLSRGGRSVGISRQEAGKVLANEGSDVAGSPVITAGLRNFGLGRSGSVAPAFFPQLPGQPGSPKPGPFGNATPIAVYSSYTQTVAEQLAVAQAALTRTTKDDVSAAKRIIARIKRLIDQGHLEGASLVQALQDEATQQGVLDNARQQAAQQAAQIAAAKQAVASSYTTPIDLQIAEVRAQLTKSSADDLRVERQILAAAKAAVASGRKNKQGQLAALQVELQAQQAIDSLRQQAATSFTLPARLQLALAKAQATGGDQTAILLKMKAALERALKAAKGNIQEQIDIYNQITSINQQLGSNVSSVLGLFKQASTKVLTQGLGLTPAQRKALRERLSQLGPGGTVPGQGTGAFGFAIDPTTGRPLHHHRRPRHRHPSQDGGGSSGGGGQPLVVNSNIELDINLDGRHLEATVRKRQQRHRRRNPSQRRGPNAATA